VEVLKPFETYLRSSREMMDGIKIGLEKSNQYSVVKIFGQSIYVLNRDESDKDIVQYGEPSAEMHVYSVLKKELDIYREESNRSKEFRSKKEKYEKFQKEFIKNSVSMPTPPKWMTDPDFYYSGNYLQDIQIKIQDLDGFLSGAETILNKKISERLSQQEDDKIRKSRAQDSLLAKAKLVGIEIRNGTILESEELDSMQFVYRKLKSVNAMINNQIRAGEKLNLGLIRQEEDLAREVLSWRDQITKKELKSTASRDFTWSKINWGVKILIMLAVLAGILIILLRIFDWIKSGGIEGFILLVGGIISIWAGWIPVVIALIIAIIIFIKNR
jgi:hypothetical protein